MINLNKKEDRLKQFKRSSSHVMRQAGLPRKSSTADLACQSIKLHELDLVRSYLTTDSQDRSINFHLPQCNCLIITMHLELLSISVQRFDLFH